MNEASICRLIDPTAGIFQISIKDLTIASMLNFRTLIQTLGCFPLVYPPRKTALRTFIVNIQTTDLALILLERFELTDPKAIIIAGP